MPELMLGTDLETIVEQAWQSTDIRCVHADDSRRRFRPSDRATERRMDKACYRDAVTHLKTVMPNGFCYDLCIVFTIISMFGLAFTNMRAHSVDCGTECPFMRAQYTCRIAFKDMRAQ